MATSSNIVIEITQHSFYFTTPLSLSCRHPTLTPPNAADEVGRCSSPPPLNKDNGLLGRCAVGTEMASCGSSCDNNRGTIRVHYGTIYVLDEFWWWMTSIARLVCPPPALFLVLQWNNFTDQGKTIWTMGMSNLWPLKNAGAFWSVDCSRHFPSIRFLF
jgi:hypothetical protein